MELIFHPEVKNDIKKLDGSVKNRLKKIFKKIKRASDLGKPLGNKSNMDLSGCLKVYFYRKKYRVVYVNAYKRILKKRKKYKNFLFFFYEIDPEYFNWFFI